ncbi:unnamed protein product, partial [Brassica rapa subsp. narinosa]
MAMQYISHSDATKRLARIQRVKQGIENNKAESSVRLTRLTSNIDKGKGHVFNYQEPDEDKGPYKLLRISSNNETDDVSSFSSHSTSSAPNLISTGFRIGPSSEGRVSGNQSQGKTQMRPHSWKRKLTASWHLIYISFSDGYETKAYSASVSIRQQKSKNPRSYGGFRIEAAASPM